MLPLVHSYVPTMEAMEENFPLWWKSELVLPREKRKASFNPTLQELHNLVTNRDGKSHRGVGTTNRIALNKIFSPLDARPREL